MHGNLRSGCGDVTIPAAHSFSCHGVALLVLIQRLTTGGKLYTYLLQYGKRRGKGGERKRTGISFNPDHIDIANPPQIINARKRIGDWEGDTVYGQRASRGSATVTWSLI